MSTKTKADTALILAALGSTRAGPAGPAGAPGVDATGMAWEDVAIVAGAQGNDAGDGSYAHPFATLGAAKDYLKAKTVGASSFERVKVIRVIGAYKDPLPAILMLPEGIWILEVPPGFELGSLMYVMDDAARGGSALAGGVSIVCVPGRGPNVNGAFGRNAKINNVGMSVVGPVNIASISLDGVDTDTWDFPACGDGRLHIQTRYSVHNLANCHGDGTVTAQHCAFGNIDCGRLIWPQGVAWNGDVSVVHAPAVGATSGVMLDCNVNAKTTWTGPAGAFQLDGVTYASYALALPALAGGATVTKVGNVAEYGIPWGYWRASDIGVAADRVMIPGCGPNLETPSPQVGWVVIPAACVVEQCVVARECSLPGGTYTLTLHRNRAGVDTPVVVKTEAPTVRAGIVTELVTLGTPLVFAPGDFMWGGITNNGFGTTEGVSLTALVKA